MAQGDPQIIYDPEEFDPSKTYFEGDLFKGVPYLTPVEGDIYEVQQDNVSGEFAEVLPFCGYRGGFAVGGLSSVG